MTAERDAWERLGWLWSAFYATTLVIGAFFSALYADGSVWHRLLPVAGAVALFALSSAATRQIPDADYPRTRDIVLAFGWYAVSIVLLVLLLEPYPQFGIVVYGFVATVFTLLPVHLAVPAAVVVVPVLLIAQGGLSVALDADTWYSALGSGLLAVVVGLFMNGVARQSLQRRMAVEALTAAQTEVAEQAHRAGVAEERARLARRDPRHARPGADRHRHPAAGGRPGRGPAGRPRPAPGQRGRRWPGRASARPAGRCRRCGRPQLQAGPAAGRARRRGRRPGPSVTTAWPPTVITTGTARQLHPEVEVALLRTGAGGAGQRRQARRRPPGSGVTLSYMEDVVDPGRARRRHRLRPGRGRRPAGLGLAGMRQRVRQRVAGSLGGRRRRTPGARAPRCGHGAGDPGREVAA